MTQYRPEIEIAAAQHGLDPDLVQAVVEQESSYRWFAYRYEPDFFSRYLKSNPMYLHRDPREVSASFGLMQVLFTTAIENGFAGKPWELFHPDVALDLGCHHLAALMVWARGLYVGLASGEQAAVTRSALAAYNGGKTGNAPTGALRNIEYVRQVLGRYERIKKEQP